MKYILLVLLTFVKGNCFSQVKPDTVQLYKNISILRSHTNNITQTNVNDGFNYLNAPAYGAFHDTLIYVLKNLLEQPSFTNMVLTRLSHTPQTEFDFEISRLVSSIDTIKTLNQRTLFQAIEKSGGPLTYEMIKRTCNRPLKPVTQKNTTIKLGLWGLLQKNDFKETITSAFIFYGSTFLGEPEVKASNQTANYLITLIRYAARNETLFMEVFPTLSSFCFANDRMNYNHLHRNGPATRDTLIIEPHTSFKYLVLKEIYDKAWAFNTPHTQAFLIEFLRCNDASLRSKSASIQYNKLTNPYLLPLDLNFTADSAIHAMLQPLLSIQPITVPYLNPLHFAAMQHFDTGLLTKLQTYPNKKSIEQLYETNSISKQLKVYYNIESIAHIPIDSFLQNQGMWFKNYTFNYVDFSNQLKLFQNNLSRDLKSQGYSTNIADSAALIITGKEMDKKAVYFYNLAFAKGRFNTSEPGINFSNVEDKFNIVISKLGNTVLKSKLVSSLLHEKTGLVSGSVRTVDSVYVTERKYSLTEGLFEETIHLFYQHAEKAVVKWVGTIPVHAIPILTRSQRIFDIIQYSFGWQDFLSLAHQKNTFVNTLDYVRSDPPSAISYLINYLNTPSMNWRDVKEAIVCNTFGDINDFRLKIDPSLTAREPVKTDKQLLLRGEFPAETPDWVKQAVLRGMPGGMVHFNGVFICTSDSSYEQQKLDALQPFYLLMYNKTVRRISEIIFAFYRDKTPENNACDPINIFCDLGLIRVENIKRKMYLDSFGPYFARCDAFDRLFSSWDLNGIIFTNDTKIYLRQMLLPPDLSKFCGTYEIRAGDSVRFVTIEGKIPNLPKELTDAVKINPGLLTVYNLDLSGSTRGAYRKISQAIQKNYDVNYTNSIFPRLLKESGYNYVKPWGLGFQPKGPLLKSGEGKILSIELNYLNGILKMGLGGETVEDYSANSNFIAGIADYWSQAYQAYLLNANANAGGIIDSYLAGKNDFEVKLGYVQNTSGDGGHLILDLRINNFVIRISASPTLDDISYSFGVKDQNRVISLSMDDLFKKSKLPAGTDFIGENPAFLPDRSTNLNFADLPSITASANVNSIPISITTNIANAQQPTQVIRLPATWMEVTPAIGPGPWSTVLQGDDQSFIASMISMGRSKYTDAEVKQIDAAVHNGVFPPGLLDILLKRRAQAQEEDKIADGDWITTDVPEGGIMPNSANMNSESAEAYLKDFNAASNASFNNQLKVKQGQCETKRIFEDGLPGMTISYSKDFTHMLWTYKWKCVDGTVLENYSIAPVWPGLTPLLKANPTGHVLEKLTDAAADNLIEWSAKNNFMNKAEKKKVEEIEKMLNDKKVSEVFSEGFKTHLEGILKKHFDDYKNWLKENADSKDGIERPFQPSPEASPIMSIFPPPFAIYLKKLDAIENKANECRNINFSKGLQNGTVVIFP